MMKKTLISICALTMLSSFAHADMKQRIKVCGVVSSFQSPYHFQIHAKSSDVFDGGFFTSTIAAGKMCNEHVYQHGPKNMSYTISAVSHNGTIHLVDIGNCGLKKEWRKQKWTVGPIRAKGSSEEMTFKITQVPSKKPNVYVYNITC